LPLTRGTGPGTTWGFVGGNSLAQCRGRNPMTRKEAMLVGDKLFFTGKPCKYGHVDNRYVSAGGCVTCALLRSSVWDKANPGRNKVRAAVWAQANPNKRRAGKAKRRAARLQRTPPWADLKAIQAFYVGCPPGNHIDHVIPLQGELISGLHVLANLQYLPSTENIAKGNRIDLTAPSATG